MFKLFLVDMGIPSGTVALWTGVYGMGFSLAGSILGGMMTSRSGPLGALRVSRLEGLLAEEVHDTVFRPF